MTLYGINITIVQWPLLLLHCISIQDMVGFNMAGLQFLQRQLDAQGQPVFADVTERLHKMRKKRKITTHK